MRRGQKALGLILALSFWAMECGASYFLLFTSGSLFIKLGSLLPDALFMGCWENCLGLCMWNTWTGAQKMSLKVRSSPFFQEMFAF